MILVFGGTTEGRKAVEVLEEAGKGYFYSTKTGEQDITIHNGQRIDGALDEEAMQTFCRQHDIRLITDAAHPFAAQLHQTIARVAEVLQLPVVRYERIYPPRDPDITWVEWGSWPPLPSPRGGKLGAAALLSPSGVGGARVEGGLTLLATTGVQSIAKLKPLEEAGVKIYYRILRRESSIALALKQGARMEQLCFYDDPNDIPVEADAILLKESGISGGFTEKVEAARARGMRIIALKRPDMPQSFITVNGPYGLRRAVEHLLPEFFTLHSGLTTGTCATAAAVAATIRLLRNERPKEVPVVLPNGETIDVPVGYGDGYAYCIKEAGDDPDVTNGIEIRAEANQGDTNQGDTNQGTNQGDRLLDSFQNHEPVPLILEPVPLILRGGEGVGRFTLPGFDYPPGEPAINKGPREMIRRNILPLTSSLFPHPSSFSPLPSSLFHLPSSLSPLTITISVPQGAEIARRTFNPRLGIEGGISIIGVSGIVKPFSEEAFIDSIRKCMTVAKASGSERVVINSGAKSERFVKALYPDLPQQAFVQYGNYIGETLRMADELGFEEVTLGVMLGKAVKLAAGHLDTHSRKSVMDKDFIRELLHEADCDIDISDLTLAREIWGKMKDCANRFVRVVIQHCETVCNPLLPNGTLTILLIDDDGNIYS